MASSSVPKNPEINRSEMEAVLGARAELGEEMEPAVVDSFAARVTSEINRQMALERAEKSRPPPRTRGRSRRISGSRWRSSPPVWRSR